MTDASTHIARPIGIEGRLRSAADVRPALASALLQSHHSHSRAHPYLRQTSAALLPSILSAAILIGMGNKIQMFHAGPFLRRCASLADALEFIRYPLMADSWFGLGGFP